MPVCAQCGHETAEAFKFCPECGAPAGEAGVAREQRKVVTVLFCDVTGSTSLGESLDPEALRRLLARYFERMQAVVERHGGTVEKFIGDAVMAVFGVPQLHEDDAARAARAAVEMRDALPELGVQGRIGVATGEVVTGTAERLATGDAVNVAARLEQAAAPGEILIGAETRALARDVIDVEAVAPVAAKGKSEPVAAWRLVSATPAGERRLGGPLVGRARQLRLLGEVFAGVCADRACHLVTMLGAAGVGKSRLVAEFLAGVDATVVRGRCLSYGEGITYWPVIEVLKQLGAGVEDDPAGTAISALLGETDEPATGDEIAWAVRQRLERAAALRPLICVFDDVHWGEPAFLDVIEHVADFSRDAPLLVVCMARPELLDRRGGWAGGKLNATTLLLEPLTAEETDELIQLLAPVDAALRLRIRAAAEGNPLFVEEMLAMVHESGGQDVVVPPTIQALLAARLDQLDPSERALLERGSVEGKVFHRGAVEALAPEERRVQSRLMGLVRKELVRPERPLLAGDDAYRFRHLLIRDAAYDGLPKLVRADLHERFAGWLEVRGRDLVELDEILGYHLEQAFRYRVELGVAGAAAGLAMAASARLAAAGRRAVVRQDFPAAANLFGRAAELAPDDTIDLGLELDRIDTLFQLGRVEEASGLASQLAERARRMGDRTAELTARLVQESREVYVAPEGATERLAAFMQEALPELEAAGSPLALFAAYRAQGEAANMLGHHDAQLEAFERALEQLRLAGASHHAGQLRPELALCRLFGSTPVPEMLAWLEAEQAVRRLDPFDEGPRAVGLAMLGRFDDARAIVASVRELLTERGATIPLALILSQLSATVELLAGNPAGALQVGREGCRMLEESGERSWQSTGIGYMAQALYELERLDEADAEAARAADTGSTDDAVTQMLWRQVRAKVHARRGEHAAAQRLAHEAVEIGSATDNIEGQGDAYADLAEVMAQAGETDAARAALGQATAAYRAKGNLVAARRVEAREAELAAADGR